MTRCSTELGLGLARLGRLGAAALALAAGLVAPLAMAQSVNATTTTSTSRSESFVDTTATARTDTFSTRLLGILDGSTTVYDMTFALPFGDAVVQAAISAAQAALTTAGSPNTVAFSGPTLTSSTTVSTGTSVSTVETGRASSESIQFFESIGPGTIQVGDYGLCAAAPTAPSAAGCTGGSPQTFDVLAGTSNTNINTHTTSTIFRTITTTGTFLTSSVYTLFGTTQGGGGGGGGGGGTVPEPGTLALVALLLLALLRTSCAPARKQPKLTLADT